MRSGSIRLDAGRLGDLAVENEFVLDQLGEPGSVERQGIGADAERTFPSTPELCSAAAVSW